MRLSANVGRHEDGWKEGSEGGREHGSGTRVEGMYLRMQYDELSFLSRVSPLPPSVSVVWKRGVCNGGHAR